MLLSASAAAAASLPGSSYAAGVEVRPAFALPRAAPLLPSETATVGTGRETTTTQQTEQQQQQQQQ